MARPVVQDPGDTPPVARTSALYCRYNGFLLGHELSLAFGGLLFLLSSGFSLIFGLMRIPNLAHGAFFMLGAYFGYTLLALKFNFWIAAIGAGLGVGLVGIILERFVLRQLPGNAQGQRPAGMTGQPPAPGADGAPARKRPGS